MKTEVKVNMIEILGYINRKIQLKCYTWVVSTGPRDMQLIKI